MITRYSRLRWLRAPFLALALLCTTGLPHLRADDPKPDPAGTATGVAADVPGFVMTAPAELSADDKKDKDKVKAYDDAKKMADDYAAHCRRNHRFDLLPNVGWDLRCEGLCQPLGASRIHQHASALQIFRTA